MKATPWPALTGGTASSISTGWADGGQSGGELIERPMPTALSVEGFALGVIVDLDAQGPAVEGLALGVIVDLDAQGPAVEGLAVGVITMLI